MKSLVPICLVAGVLLLPKPSASDAPSASPIRCQFPPGRTNAYRVEFDTTTGDQASTLTGVVLVHVRKVEAGVGTVGFSGRLTPQPPPGSPPNFAMPFRPHRGLWPPRPMVLQPHHELRVNPRGQVVRQAALAPSLPAPFGSVLGLFFQSLPTATDNEWQSVAEVWIEDEAASDTEAPPQFGPFGEPRASHLIAATRRETARFKEVSEGAVTVESSVELESWLQVAGEPRLQATAKGQLVLDRATGWIRSAEIQARSVITSPNWSWRRPMVLRLRALEGDDLARELAALQVVEPAPVKVTRAELPGLLQDLESPDEVRRSQAISRLHMCELEEATPELLAAAVKLAGSSQYPERTAANHLLGRHGTAAEVPAMLRLLAWSQPGNQREVLEALGRLRDPRAIAPLADMIARGNFEAEYVVQVLQRFGPAAEPAALELFKERHAETRRLACSLLAEVGTEKAAEPLREVMLDPDEQVAQAAAQALRAIQQRAGNLPSAE
jgi:HEAT repeat protein